MSTFADEGTIAHALAARCLEENKNAADFVGQVFESQDYAHASLSPSSAHRWMACPGSHALEGDSQFVERKFSQAITAEMAEHVQVYVDNIRLYAKGNMLFIEERVDLSEVLGIPDQGGTSDAIIITSDGDELQTHDLKFGMGVEVSAVKNEQLMQYALGALRKFDYICSPKRIRLVIHQPRINKAPSEWDCSVEDLIAFEKESQYGALAAQNAKTIHQTTGLHAGSSYLNPGEKQCRFCKAKATCPALAKHISDLAAADFETVAETQEPIAVPHDAKRLGAIIDAEDLIEAWLKACRAKAESDVLAGVPVIGKDGPYKIVQGKKGNRAWVDEEKAEEQLKAMRLKADEMYVSKVITPTQAEKVLKESPRKWKKLEPFITQAEGGKHLAPASDKRQAIVTKPAEDDFETIDEQPAASVPEDVSEFA